MANIKVNNLSSLNITGADLFNDAESFMTELNEEKDLMRVIGGDADCQNKSRVLCLDGTCNQTHIDCFDFSLRQIVHYQ